MRGSLHVLLFSVVCSFQAQGLQELGPKGPISHKHFLGMGTLSTSWLGGPRLRGQSVFQVDILRVAATDLAVIIKIMALPTMYRRKCPM